MPLNTYIVRDGENLKLPNGWGGFHVVAMTLAAAFDSGRGPFVEGQNKPQFEWPKESPNPESPIPEEWLGKDESSYPDVPQPITRGDEFRLMGYHILALTPLNEGSYVLKNRHKFVDCSDGEVLELLPGDELHAYRS